MEDVNLKIKELINVKFNGNKSSFARKLGISEGNVRGYVANIEPKYSFFARLFRALPEISHEWLFCGKGEMIKQDKIIPHLHQEIKENNNTQVTGDVSMNDAKKNEEIFQKNEELLRKNEELLQKNEELLKQNQMYLEIISNLSKR